MTAVDITNAPCEQAAWITAYLGLGANLGNRAENIQAACRELDALPTINVVKASSLYETSPVGFVDQPEFLNAAAEIATTLAPEELLAQIMQIEQALGRTRTLRWGPRLIDIDILAYGGQVVSEPGLVVPHPRLLERAFVLVPLAEIAPALLLPGEALPVGRKANQLIKSGNIQQINIV